MKAEEVIKNALRVMKTKSFKQGTLRLYNYIDKINECDKFILVSDGLNKQLWKLNKYIYLKKLQNGVHKLYGAKC